MEYGVEVWEPEGGLKENDRSNKIFCEEIKNLHRLDATNMFKREYEDQKNV